MMPSRKILASFLAADEAERCSMYLTYRDMRRCFEEIELQEEMGVKPTLECKPVRKPLRERRVLGFLHKAFSS